MLDHRSNAHIIRLGSVALLALASLVISPRAGAQDLIIDGTSQTLGGTHTYDSVQVINGGILYVETYDGDPSTTGTLRIIADSIEVDATSYIIADGSGYRADLNALAGMGEGDGGGQGGSYVIDGAGGGAYGADGGDGVRDYWQLGGCALDGQGGVENGDDDTFEIDMGSAGGSGGSGDGDGWGGGGDGAGAIWLEADVLTIAGTVRTNGGAAGVFLNDSGGGGAGGGILLWTASANITGTLQAIGGVGHYYDDGGGGGSGGRVKVFYMDGTVSPTVDVAGTVGGNNSYCGSFMTGGDGSSFSVDTDTDD
ncbi:MAG: hypothetical protein QGH45_13440, partial [Myxococcota bacterium]|nr:hypothetical protein [Myxococcota bacterium]